MRSRRSRLSAIRSADNERALKTLNEGLSPEVRSLIPKRWNWRDQARLVDMTDEYDFIYTYTSRLLHATPASLRTNQKNLEHDEVRLFLKYVHVRLLDVVDLATAVLARAVQGDDLH